MCLEPGGRPLPHAVRLRVVQDLSRGAEFLGLGQNLPQGAARGRVTVGGAGERQGGGIGAVGEPVALRQPQSDRRGLGIIGEVGEEQLQEWGTGVVAGQDPFELLVGVAAALMEGVALRPQLPQKIRSGGTSRGARLERVIVGDQWSVGPEDRLAHSHPGGAHAEQVVLHLQR